MTNEEIRRRFCEDITAFNNGEINATILYDRAVRLGEESIIDKALEQFEKELRQMKNILNAVKPDAGKLISVGGSLSQFKKALKED